MVKRKGTTIRGRAAKAKGSRAERKVRDALKRIYPQEKRERVQRVPMSGAGWMKGDVYDGNDPDTCYEVKCQETLCLPDWWRQAKSQAGTSRTPVLVITQAYRPFYYILRQEDWDEQVAHSEFDSFTDATDAERATNLMDRLADLGARQVMHMTIDDDQCSIVPETFYLEVKSSLYSQYVLNLKRP